MLRASTFLGLLAVLAINGSLAARQYKLVCYYSSWATYRNGNGQFTSRDIDPQQCTHVVYAFSGLDSNFEIRILDPWLSLPDGGGKDDFDQFVSLRRSNPSLKLMMGVGGWNEGSPRYSQMASVPKYRKTFIDSIINFCKRYGFDGLNLDWQYPGNRGGLAVDKKNFVILLKEIRDALSAQKLAFGISAAANLDITNAGYDVPEVTKYVDYVSLLTYDYHGSWESKTGMNSPLYPHLGASSSDKSLTQDASVQHWIKKGADRSKLLLGLATYGRTYVLRDIGKNRIGDASFRPGNPGPYTQQDGFLGYNEIIDKFNAYDGWTVRHDQESKVPYAYLDDLWISYDNPWSFGLKAEYAKKQGLGGVMVYSLDTDDFLNSGPLVKALVDVLEDGKVVPTVGPDPETPATGKPTPKPDRFQCKSLGMFQDPQDCRKFYTCIASGNGFSAISNRCPDGLAFDNSAKACNWIDAVPECNI